jgi:ubiquinone/menaquinone biosynthesis C-methylase UbiE
MSAAAPASNDTAAFDSFEAAGWQDCASTFVEGFAEVTGQLADPLLDACDVGAGTLVLDVGCGPGQVAAAAGARGATAIGVDVSRPMVEIAASRHPGIEFVVADAYQLPFEDGAFDVVIANMLLLHLGRPEDALAEGRRVLAPGGRVAFTTYDTPDKSLLVGVLLKAIGAVGPEPVDGIPPGPDMFALADDGEATRLLAAAGFEPAPPRAIALEAEFADADSLWTALSEGTVRAAALLQGQSAENLAKIRAAFEANIAGLAFDGGYRVPAAFRLSHGAVPAAAGKGGS